MIAVPVTDFSKRTIGRIGYAMVDNDSRGLYTLGGLGAANAWGISSRPATSFDHRW